MRKTAIALLVLGLAVTFAATASATVFYTETFSYPDGPLGATPAGTVNATTGWLTHSGTGGGVTDIQVVSGVCVGNMANAPDDSRPFAPGFTITTGPTDKTYSCMLVTIPSIGAALSAGAIYFAHFKDNIPTGTTFSDRVFITGITGNAAQYTIGIGAGSSVTPVNWATPLSVGTTYVIATRFDAATGTATLWVNPASEASLSVSATDAVTVGRGLAAYAFRQSTGNWGYRVDDLRVGTSFDETCAGQPTKTSTATWGRMKTLYR